MTPWRWLAWATAAAISVSTAWLGWRGPAASPNIPTPPPLARPATPAERADVDQRAAAMQTHIDAATQALGRFPRADELEGLLPDGQPVLPGGLTDNPLLPGVGGVMTHCPATSAPETSLDWTYCESTGRIAASLPDHSPSANR